jgi:hypothetical protein
MQAEARGAVWLSVCTRLQLDFSRMSLRGDADAYAGKGCAVSLRLSGCARFGVGLCVRGRSGGARTAMQAEVRRAVALERVQPLVA